MKTVLIVLGVLFALWLAKRLMRRVALWYASVLRSSPEFCGYCLKRGGVVFLVNSPNSEEEPTYTCEACLTKLMPVAAREWALQRGRLIPVERKP